MSILALNNLGVPLLQNPRNNPAINPSFTLARFEDQLVYDDAILKRIEEAKKRKEEAVSKMEFERA